MTTGGALMPGPAALDFAVKAAAAGGWNLQLASPFSYRTYREAWIDKLAENLQLYEQECERQGRDPKAAEAANICVSQSRISGSTSSSWKKVAGIGSVLGSGDRENGKSRAKGRGP